MWAARQGCVHWRAHRRRRLLLHGAPRRPRVCSSRTGGGGRKPEVAWGWGQGPLPGVALGRRVDCRPGPAEPLTCVPGVAKGTACLRRSAGRDAGRVPSEEPVQDITSPRGYAAREVGFRECQVDLLRDHCPARSDKAGLVLTQTAKFNKGSLSSSLVGYTCPTERRGGRGGLLCFLWVFLASTGRKGI